MNKVCKAILIGESGVGKTCIIKRFVLDNEFNVNETSTLGASYFCKEMEFPNYDTSIEFQVWDTAGQEKYRGLQKLFYKDAKIIILVYDTTRNQTFTEIKDYWYNQVKQNATNNYSK